MPCRRIRLQQNVNSTKSEAAIGAIEATDKYGRAFDPALHVADRRSKNGNLICKAGKAL